MSSTAIIVSKNKVANSERLALLGITEELLTQSIWTGLIQHRATSRLEPLNAGGSKAYFAIIKALREQLLGNGLGWKQLNQNGQSLVINPVKKINIIVTSGDKYTGLNYGVPCTKNGKGSETKNYVHKNIGQNFNLFEDGIVDQIHEFDGKVLEPVDGTELWVLLYHFDFSGKEVRFELSLPIGIKEVGNNGKVKVSEWADRIIFNALSFEENKITNESPKFNEDIEFIIKSKD
jgi:hypothetical protein